MRRIECYLPLLLAALALPGCCCPPIQAARDAAKQAQSMNNMHQLGIAIHNYQNVHGDWPESLEDLRDFVEGYNEVTTNPVTGDSPGYEYVKPEEEQPSPDTVWIYQLRGGVRDMELVKGYADGSVH